MSAEALNLEAAVGRCVLGAGAGARAGAGAGGRRSFLV